MQELRPSEVIRRQSSRSSANREGSQIAAGAGGSMFGEIEFSGLKQQAKFVRVENSLPSAAVQRQILTKKWELARPTLVINIFGGGFEKKRQLRMIFKKGLWKAAESAGRDRSKSQGGCWIISSGFNVGIMKLTGEAVRDYTDAYGANHMIAIGVGSWGCVAKRRALEQAGGSSSAPVSYQSEETESSEQAADDEQDADGEGQQSMLLRPMRPTDEEELLLDPNHTHFFLVDTGSALKKGREQQFRSSLEQAVSNWKAEDDSDVKVPMCGLLVGGDRFSLEQVFHALTTNMCPIVALKGTAGAADVLAMAIDIFYREPAQQLMEKKEPETEAEKDDRFFEEMLIVCQEMFCTHDYFDFRHEIEMLLILVKQYMSLIEIFDMEEDYDLDGKMITSLLSSAGSDCQRNQLNLKQLKICLTLNRSDIARDKIFLENKKWKKGDLNDFMYQALMDDRHEFVKLLLEQGFSLEDFLTVYVLEKLYTDQTKRLKLSIFKQLWEQQKHRSVKKVRLKDVGKVVKILVGDFYQPLYTKKEFEERLRGEGKNNGVGGATATAAATANFRIDPRTGVISLRPGHRLDRETQPVHLIPLVARDAGKPIGRSASLSLSLSLMDVNDNPPRFVKASLEASLSELTPVGHRILRLQANSSDSGANAEIRYRLLDNDGLFSVDSVSGELTLKSPLDYEQRREFHLTVRAFDASSRPLSATAVVTVRVLDENDNPPEFPHGGFNVTARENADPGTRLSADIVARDADSGDNARLAYRIEAGDPDRMFTLDSASGRFYARRRLDRETQEQYSLTVTAADSGRPPLTATTTVRVTVLDQNDCNPQFDRLEYTFIAQVDDAGNITQQPYLEDTDPEDPNASVIRVTDCDAPPNGGPFVWSVVEGNSMKYVVNSGRLRLSEGFPQPLGTEHIRVQACDGGDVIRCSSAQASIRTVRTRAAPPRILPQNLTAVFAEPPAPGLRLGGVALAGGRQPDDSTVRLRLASHADRFELGRTGDLLVSNGNLVASRTDYWLRVRAETLNGLRSAQELRLRVVMATEDMLQNAVCLRISNESSFSFVFSGLEPVTREEISQQLGIDSDDAFVLGLKNSADMEGDATDNRDDLLVVFAAYDRRHRRYLTRTELTARLRADRVASALGGGGRRVAIATADAAGLCPLEARLATPPTPAAIRLATARASFLAPEFRLRAPPATDGCWRSGRLSSSAATARPPAAAVHAQGEARAVWSLDGGLQRLRLELRTVQTQPGPVVTLRTASGQREVLQLRIGADGRLSVGPLLAADGTGDLAMAGPTVNDGRWHSAEVRILRPTGADGGSAASVQLLVDSIDPQFASLPSDSPLAAADSHEVALGRGFTGCLRDMRGPAAAPRLRLSGASEGLRPGCSDSLLAEPCARTPCQHGGACESGSAGGGFSCRCPSPYVGARCEVNAEPCATASAAGRCRNGGRCRSGPAVGQAACDCSGTGFEGDTCETDIDECRLAPAPGLCSGRGVCRNLPGGFHCNCTGGFAGPTCAGLPSGSNGNASIATASFSPLEVATVAGSALLLLVLAFVVFLCVSCLCRRRTGGADGSSGRRRKSRGGGRGHNNGNGNCNGNGSPATAFGCELHDPPEAMALVTLASGETRLVPQKELGSLGVGMGPALGSAGPSPTYACYERPRPPSSTAATAIGNGRYPSQLVAESVAGTPTRCLTPRGGGGGGYPPRFPQVRLPAAAAAGDFLVDEQGLRAAAGGPSWQCSCWMRRGYHWDTSDWNSAANPPDLIPDHSPYCVYSGPNGLQYFSHGRCGGGGGGGSSGFSSPAHQHHHQHHHQHQSHQHHQHHQLMRPANSLLLSASASASVAGSLRGVGGGGGGGGRCCSRCGGVGGSFESLGSGLSSVQQQQQRGRGPASLQLPPLEADGEAEVAPDDVGSQLALLLPAAVAASPSASSASPASTTIAAVAAFAASPPPLIESPAEDVEDAADTTALAGPQVAETVT